MDEGHIITDKILADLEKGLLEVYKDSYNSIKPQLEEVKDLIEKLSEEDDPVKRLVLQRREKRLTILLNNISKDIREVNILATKMINDEMLNVYAENINYGAYFLESESGYKLNFDLYNKEILKKLYKDNENPFTKIALKNIKDKSRIYRDLRRNFAAAIRNGETIKEIAKRVQGIVNKNMNDSIRIARTETTRLESMGREEIFNKGMDMGLKMKKVWISTSDKRTRESHLMLNGKAIDMDKRFSNGLLYPGEHGGRAEEVINCRCTHIVELQGVKKSANLEKLDRELEEVNYQEWKKRVTNEYRK